MHLKRLIPFIILQQISKYIYIHFDLSKSKWF